ncbi:hypothetical protein LCM20_01585 [Halobacillus litoralis]|uniref:hypothetical protein n=1 Tax=Halobacillus litoralis TaxID=45668 RepID=UPI001CD51C24|nr:hypothetical protein [Halobacillus litoralis]MCA0969278.1 hypothetical protein [Halobacillus litoralis]
MRIWWIICILLLLVGCGNETSLVKGEAYGINEDQSEFTLFKGYAYSLEEMSEGDYDEYDPTIEAARIRVMEETVFEGEVSSFEELQSAHKVEVVVNGGYEKKLVSAEELVDVSDDLKTYEAERITVTPYTKEELVSEMTAEEGKLSLYVYNTGEAEEMGSYRDVIGDTPISQVSIEPTFTNGVQNQAELLGIHEEGPTYIVTDEEGIVFRTHKLEELRAFFDERNQEEGAE